MFPDAPVANCPRFPGAQDASQGEESETQHLGADLHIVPSMSLKLYAPVGYRRAGTFPNNYVFLLSWSTGRYFGYAPASCSGAMSLMRRFQPSIRCVQQGDF